MSLLVKANREGAEIVRVTPESAGWKYVGFAAYRLAPDEEVAPRTSATDEICIVLLSGTVSVKTEGQTWRELSGRTSVFEPRRVRIQPAPGIRRYRDDQHSRSKVGARSGDRAGHFGDDH